MNTYREIKAKREGDDERIKNAGLIAEETCDDDIWKEIPATLLEALGELPLSGNKFDEPSINQRLDEMRANDLITGEHPEANDEQYLEWAIEEFDLNHDEYKRMAEEEKI